MWTQSQRGSDVLKACGNLNYGNLSGHYQSCLRSDDLLFSQMSRFSWGDERPNRNHPLAWRIILQCTEANGSSHYKYPTEHPSFRQFELLFPMNTLSLDWTSSQLLPGDHSQFPTEAFICSMCLGCWTAKPISMTFIVRFEPCAWWIKDMYFWCSLSRSS